MKLICTKCGNTKRFISVGFCCPYKERKVYDKDGTLIKSETIEIRHRDDSGYSDTDFEAIKKDLKLDVAGVEMAVYCDDCGDEVSYDQQV